MLKKFLNNFRQNPNDTLIVNFDGSVRLNTANADVRKKLMIAAKKQVTLSLKIRVNKSKKIAI